MMTNDPGELSDISSGDDALFIVELVSPVTSIL